MILPGILRPAVIDLCWTSYLAVSRDAFQRPEVQ
jgi:hypothetical protein